MSRTPILPIDGMPDETANVCTESGYFCRKCRSFEHIMCQMFWIVNATHSNELYARLAYTVVCENCDPHGGIAVQCLMQPQIVKPVAHVMGLPTTVATQRVKDLLKQGNGFYTTEGQYDDKHKHPFGK